MHLKEAVEPQGSARIAKAEVFVQTGSFTEGVSLKNLSPLSSLSSLWLIYRRFLGELFIA